MTVNTHTALRHSAHRQMEMTTETKTAFRHSAQRRIGMTVETQTALITASYDYRDIHNNNLIKAFKTESGDDC